MTRNVIAYPLSVIFSKSVETSILPGDWKLAEVLYLKNSKITYLEQKDRLKISVSLLIPN